MTQQKTFKKIVRSRMEKTGESYTAARAALLGDRGSNGSNGSAPAVGTPLTASEEVITRRTGHGWEHWFSLLDDAGAQEMSHREIAAWMRENTDIGGWNSQSVTTSYERARKGRAVGQHDDGFTVTASKTVNVPVEVLFDAFVEEEPRRRWLPEGVLRERTSNRPVSARFDWEDGSTRVVAGFESKGPGKSLVAMAHEKLPDAEEGERMKAYWREAVAALKEELEG